MKIFAEGSVAIKELNDFSKITKVYLVMGRACNLYCRHCTQVPVKSDVIQYDKVNQDVWKFVDNYISYAISHTDKQRVLYFWGGEPLIYWDFIKKTVSQLTFKYDLFNVPKNRFVFSINTNGLLLDDDKVNFLNDFFVRVGFSFDAPYPFAVRGRIPEKVIHYVRKLKRCCILSSFNALNCDYYLASKLIAKLFPKFTHVYNFNLMHTFDMSSDIYTISEDELRKNFKKLMIAVKTGDKEASVVLTHMLWRLQYPGKQLFFKENNVRGCFSGTNIYAVQLDGSILSCYNSSEIVGSLNDSVSDIFNKSFACFSSRRSEYCKDCEHIDVCSGVCTFNLKDENGSYLVCEKLFKPFYSVLKEEFKNILVTVSEEDLIWFMNECEKDTVFLSEFSLK